MNELKNKINNIKFNKENALNQLNLKFNELSKNIKYLEQKAEEYKIYIQTNESNEREKIIYKLFPFMRLKEFHIYNYNNYQNELINNIEQQYKNKFKNVLIEIGFISINEKTKVIRCKKYHYLNLYPLTYVADWQTNLNSEEESIKIIKEYKNGNIDFIFKEEFDYLKFKEIVFYSNETTLFICDNAPTELITKYKELYKNKGLNEYIVLREWAEQQKLKDINNINYYLINKSWGLF